MGAKRWPKRILVVGKAVGRHRHAGGQSGCWWLEKRLDGNATLVAKADAGGWKSGWMATPRRWPKRMLVVGKAVGWQRHAGGQSGYWWLEKRLGGNATPVAKADTGGWKSGWEASPRWWPKRMLVVGKAVGRQRHAGGQSGCWWLEKRLGGNATPVAKADAGGWKSGWEATPRRWPRRILVVGKAVGRQRHAGGQSGCWWLEKRLGGNATPVAKADTGGWKSGWEATPRRWPKRILVVGKAVGWQRHAGGQSGCWWLEKRLGGNATPVAKADAGGWKSGWEATPRRWPKRMLVVGKAVGWQRHAGGQSGCWWLEKRLGGNATPVAKADAGGWKSGWEATPSHPKTVGGPSRPDRIGWSARASVPPLPPGRAHARRQEPPTAQGPRLWEPHLTASVAFARVASCRAYCTLCPGCCRPASAASPPPPLPAGTCPTG